MVLSDTRAISSPAPQRPSSAQGPKRTLPIAGTAAVLGAMSAAASTALSWNPSFWGDEAASILSAQRPLSTLFPMLGEIDAVHGVYYVFLHFWIRIFGISEFAVRLPSAIAVGVATAGIVILASQLADRRVALIAGAVCVILPRFTLMGAEARSYAFSTTIAVWVTVLLVQLVRRRERRWMPWLGYAALLAAGIYVFLYLVLLVAVHAAFVAIDSRARGLLKPWAVAAGTSIVLAIPIVLTAVSERHQIAFLAHRTTTTIHRVLVTQWFGNTPTAIAAWSLIAIALTSAVVAAIRRLPGRSGRLVLLSVLWLVIPTALLVAGNALITPMYSVRYLSFVAPAAALLIAVGVNALARRRFQIATLAVIAALALPTWFAQRTEFAKDGGSDWRQVSQFIGANASPGDGIYFDPTTKPSRRPRLAMHLYPNDYAGLVDVALRVPFDAHPGLWDLVDPLADAGQNVAGVDRVWVVDLAGSTADTTTDQRNVLADDGFALVNTTELHRTTVYEYSR